MRGHGALVVQEYLADVGGEQLEVGREGFRHPPAATPVPADVPSETLCGTGHQGQADDGGGPAQELVQHVVVGTLLLDIEGPGHTEHRGVHSDVALPADGLGDLGGGPVPVEAETEGTVPAEELG